MGVWKIICNFVEKIDDMIKKWILLLVAGLLLAPASYGESRDEIAAIGRNVGAEGKFSYWAEGSVPLAKLKAFVERVTNPQSDGFVPQSDRVAVFDLDGTLVCETAPSYFEWMMYLHRVYADSTFHPTAEQQATADTIRKAVYARSVPGGMMWTEAIAQNEVFAGMTVEQYRNYTLEFMKAPVEGMRNLRWGEAIYLPMAEVVGYLAANGFATYVVSGSERQVTRVYVDGALAMGRNHIIGSDAYTYATSQGGKEGWDYSFEPTDDVVRGAMYVKNLKMNKVSAIVREIGIKPILAFGNSSGDFSMFEYAVTKNRYPSMAFCVLADDVEREFGNPAKAAKMKASCEAKHWTTISMKDDFKTIYGYKVTKE